MMRRVLLGVLAVLVLVPLASEVAIAQKKKAAPAAEAKPAENASEIPDGPVLSMLIRRTLLTLNNANISGNYTVMRDLAAPGFQAANNAARLAEIFAALRNQNIDMAPIMYFDPKLVREPQITPNGLLRVSGFIPTQPQQINFDMLFQQIAGKWLLFGIAVNTSPATTATASPAKSNDANKKKK